MCRGRPAGLPASKAMKPRQPERRAKKEGNPPITTPPNLWAPDINNVNGQWYLYYAASTFGSQRSAIGLATATNIEGRWTDRGEVIRSTTSNNYTAIDP